MFKILLSKVKLFFITLKKTSSQLKNQHAYENHGITACPKTGKHRINVKIIGKGQSVSYLAEEIAADDSFLMGFSPQDIRTIVYLATSDKYETILENEKIKKCYDLIQSRSVKGDKTVKLKHKVTDEVIVVPLKSFADGNLIEKLESRDAYNLGYLAGQEQTWKDMSKLKVIVNNKEKVDE